MTDHELKEKMMKEMIYDLVKSKCYGNALEDLADELIRAGWRKNER